MSSPESPTPRAQPYYCPYCGEQDIRPAEDPGTYGCRTCLRVWRLTFEGTGS